MVNNCSSTVSAFHPSSFRVLLTYPQRLKIETLQISDASNSDVGNSDDGDTLHREALVIATGLLKGPTLKISSDASNRDVGLEIATRRRHVRETLKMATRCVENRDVENVKNNGVSNSDVENIDAENERRRN